jgi:alpha-glucosidase (family GH31 glycosyl hydrolase)
VITPQADYTLFTPSSWNYNLWTDFFIAPVVNENDTSIEITFPVEYNWIDYWTNATYEAGIVLRQIKNSLKGSTISYDVSSLAIFPVFTRQYSMVPLAVSTDTVGNFSSLRNIC